MHDLERTLVVAIGFVILVVFALLRNVRATMIPSAAVPVSLIDTFAERICWATASITCR
jgi:multidrug efflux pump